MARPPRAPSDARSGEWEFFGVRSLAVTTICSLARLILGRRPARDCTHRLTPPRWPGTRTLEPQFLAQGRHSQLTLEVSPPAAEIAPFASESVHDCYARWWAGNTQPVSASNARLSGLSTNAQPVSEGFLAYAAVVSGN
jgi:hypothetical protein